MPKSNLLKSQAALRAFRQNLLAWYAANKRPLPWRRTRDPYAIWVSEIMLQQTRVAAVLEHYRLFLKRFPTVERLAGADETEVLAAWSGLGYYRRARMLHRAARQLAAESMGLLPGSSMELRTLPGIGRYTANAIASIAFGEPVAVLDGNVERVLLRILGTSLSAAEAWTTAQHVLDATSPGDFNQAMMELGATLCVPGAPLCDRCPVKRQCASRGLNFKKPSPPELRLHKSAQLCLRRSGDSILLRRRPRDERLMPGMWELPEFRGGGRRNPLLVARHSITTTDWTVSVFPGNRGRAGKDTSWIELGDLARFPLTGLTRKILRRLSLLQ